MSRNRRPCPAANPGPRAVLVKAPSAPTATAVLGTGSVSTALLSGTVPADSPLTWPLVVLALGSMTYDLGVRALHHKGH
ncbi:hypothetical protein DY245_06975 [Streptomyces inhibens]|uniref:Uncharacterized protein n=1 Tax=Streptomyces inhibens TaxID=2293571 RepID=A0A371Q8J9_STRIH|nr:hypothetical protein [Streptomyces inhibens]REK90998.1 hypothetical protein DY245_06975 [Streptomyces inhibens]